MGEGSLKELETIVSRKMGIRMGKGNAGVHYCFI